MNRSMAWTPVLCLAMTASVAHPARAQSPLSRSELEPIEVEMFYQYSVTDDDAEVTIDVESSDHAIDVLTVLAPDGHTVATIRSKDDLGLAEIELESAEPSVEDVQQAYPEGRYWFLGRAVDGVWLFGRIRLTHAVGGAPDFTGNNPCDEEVDPSSPVTITWSPVDGADGGYEIIIEQDDTGDNLRITQTPTATEFRIPDGFLRSGLEYEIEMKSVTGAGNKTSASCEFSTS